MTRPLDFTMFLSLRPASDGRCALRAPDVEHDVTPRDLDAPELL